MGGAYGCRSSMEQSPEAVWQECLDIVGNHISRQSFKTWFEPLRAVALKEEGGLRKLTVQLPSRFYYEWLEEHYFGLLRRTVTKVLGPKGRLFYDVVIENESPGEYEGTSMHLPARQPSGHAPRGPQRRPASPQRPQGGTPAPDATAPQHRSSPAAEAPPPQPSAAERAAPETHPFALPGNQQGGGSRLNDAYTFERFIEGDCNRLARSASWAIAQEPGATSFNPFLIYGGVGLGKTHLIQAIGNYAQTHGKADAILYVSSERFTTDFVQAIQNNRISQFSLFYRQIDLLIVDDVQFFGGKEKTQEEFFHIFNALHQAGKQIILSADRAPSEIDGIEERLLSRFQWGLSADVQAPGLETRIAILPRKAQDDGIVLPQEVIEFMAHNIKSNIRELEGALIRLLAHATLHQRELELPLAKEVLRDLVKDRRVHLTIEEIQRIVCEYLGIDENTVRAKKRTKEAVRARQIAMYFCKKLTDHSLKTIGLHFGGRDHSTVIHSINKVNDYLETDPQYRSTIEDLRQKIDLRSR